MFETIINLLTRFVEAHERLANAYETFLGEHSARMEEIKTEVVTEVPTQTVANITAKWNPLTEKVMAKYSAEKRAVLEALAGKLGIAFDPKLTGGQLHQLILDHAGPEHEATTQMKSAEAPKAEENPFDAFPAEEKPAFVPTPDELKAAVKAWAVAHGGLEAAQNLMSEVSGGRARKLAEIEALEDAEAVRCALFAKVKGE